MAVNYRKLTKILVLNLLLLHPAGLLEQLLYLRSLVVQGQLTSDHAPQFVITFLAVWEKAYIHSHLLSSAHHHTYWLSLAAPLLLELLGSLFSHDTVQQSISDTLPFITLSIVKACRTCFSCIPVRYGCLVRDSTVQRIRIWLLQHPEELRSLVTSLASTGVRWFLWAAAAAFAEGAFTTAPSDTLPVPKGELYADYDRQSRLSYQDMISPLVGTGAKNFEVFLGELLCCLDQLYLVFPAEHGLSRLIQAGSRGAHGVSCWQEHDCRNSAERCSSSRNSSSGSSSSRRSSSETSSSSSSRSRATVSSFGDEGECLDELEGTGSSSHNRMQQEASEDVGEDWSSCDMEDLNAAAAAAAAAAYAPNRKGHAPPASPADMHWLCLIVPDSSFSASSATAAIGGAEEAVPPAIGQAAEVAAQSVAEGAAAGPATAMAAPPAAAATWGRGEPMPGISGWYPAPPTLPHLQLVLELALLTWRTAGKGPKEESCHCVLLLVGLLQQSSVEVRQQLMEHRGSLLLQLLYHVLREDTALGGEGILSSTFGPFGVVLGADVVQKISDLKREGEDEEEWCADGVAGIIAAEKCQPSVHLMVLMALQSLMYELLPLESDGMFVEQLGGMITLYGGELRIRRACIRQTE